MIIASLFATMFVIDKAHTMMSGGQIAMEGVVAGAGTIRSVWFARKKKAKGWLK